MEITAASSLLLAMLELGRVDRFLHGAELIHFSTSPMVTGDEHSSFDVDLNWTSYSGVVTHIANCHDIEQTVPSSTPSCSSALSQLYVIYQRATKSLVQAFISSRLDYCNAILYGLPDKLMRRLQSVQNAAARLITGASRRDHITPILRQLHWLPVRRRVDFKIAVLVFQCLTGQAPGYLACLRILIDCSQLSEPITTCCSVLPSEIVMYNAYIGGRSENNI